MTMMLAMERHRGHACGDTPQNKAHSIQKKKKKKHNL